MVKNGPLKDRAWRLEQPYFLRAVSALCLASAGLLAGCAHEPTRSDFLARRLSQPSLVALERSDAGWTLTVEGAPYFVRGAVYAPNGPGSDPGDAQRWTDWAYQDEDGNGRPDGPYDAWVDADGDGSRDAEEARVGDFALLREMGVNTILWYHNAYPAWIPNKDVLRDLYLNYGIRVAVGDLFGAFPAELGHPWEPGTDYADPSHRRMLLESVERMVREHRDEPYVLVWLLGRGNNWAESRTNAMVLPEAYASLVNEAAALIHALDRNHPVALVNEDLGLLPVYAERCPEVDILAVNVARGFEGFGALWSAVKEKLKRPVLVASYGGADAPAYFARDQLILHEQYWREIEAQRAGSGEGIALGGFAGEWTDRWWAAGSPHEQARPGTSAVLGSRTLGAETEWGGIWGHGDGLKSPFVRRPRLVYCMYQSLWREESAPLMPWCESQPELDDRVARRLVRQRNQAPQEADEAHAAEDPGPGGH